MEGGEFIEIKGCRQHWECRQLWGNAHSTGGGMHGDEGVQEVLGVQVDQLGERVKIRGYGQLQGAAGSSGGVQEALVGTWGGCTRVRGCRQIWGYGKL